MKRNLYLILSMLGYIALVAALIARHAVWQDEAQAWLIARDLPFFSLFSLAGYEGNGMLWHALIYPLAHAGLGIWSMQALNAAFAAAAAFIVLRWAPFSRAMRLLVVSGYFFVFEYGVIARNYALSMFLIVLIAHLYKTRFIRPVRFFILLGLLSLTNVHSCLIALVIAALFCYEGWSSRAVSRKGLLVCGAFFAFICGAQAILLQPPSDLWRYTSQIRTDLTYQHVLSAASPEIVGFAPVPPLDPVFWNRSMFDELPIDLLLAAAFAALSFAPFVRHRRLFLAYAAMLILLGALFFFKPGPSVRHDGFVYLAWLLMLWVSRLERAGRPLIGWKGLPGIGECFVCTVLALHFIATAVAVGYSFAYRFSGSRDMSAYIANLPKNAAVISYPGWVGTAIAPYLAPDFRFICSETGLPCSYVTWTKAYDKPADNAESTRATISAFRAAHPDRPQYLLLRQKSDFRDIGLSEEYHMYASVFGTCTSGAACNYYLYVYRPEAPAALK